MHETGIMMETLDLADRQARAAGAHRIHQLRLRIGTLSGVVPEALRLAFEAAKPGTLAEGAQLEIDWIPASCWCERCGREFDTPDFSQECPTCGQPSLDLRHGLELELTSMEIS